MTDVKTVIKNWSRLSNVQRQSAVSPRNTIFSPTEEQLISIGDTGESTSSIPLCELPQQKLLQTQLTNQTSLVSSNSDIHTGNTGRVPTSPLEQSLLVQNETNGSKQKAQSISSNCFKRCIIRSTCKQKIACALMLTIFLLLVIVAVIFSPIYVFGNRQVRIESSFTNITASICSAATCIGKETPYQTSMITVVYPFDGNANDLSGYATGNEYGNPPPTYSTPNYVGTYALKLASASFQYVQISYVNLAQSFTIEVWVYPQVSLAGDYGIFSQCDSNSKCLSLSLRNGRVALSFDAMNITNNTLASSSLIILSYWTHVTVAYNATLFQQQIYINGRIDAITTGTVSPYAGTSSGSITTIGRSASSAYGLSYYQGQIDQLTISVGTVRTACQIYNDATLVAYYPFNLPAMYNDYSVNLFQGLASGVLPIPGFFGQALYFQSNTGFFQVTCFTNAGTATTPFSISLWLKPDNTTRGGSLVHVSSLQNGGGVCYDLLSFSSKGSLIVQLMQTTLVVNGTEGPIVPANTWTHVAVVFGVSNGLRIYVNGLLRTVSVGASQGQNGVITPQFITIGNNNPLGIVTSVSCRNGSIPITPGSYRGAIDEFRLYSRELDNQEICVLANM